MKLLYDYALSFLGQPYRWGGDDPIDGYDCSGLVQEILASVGADPAGDQTAQTLFEYFRRQGRISGPALGALAFYGQNRNAITHVAFCLDRYRVIEAGGGGSKTTTREEAAKQNAFVRVRTFTHRKDLVAIWMPEYVSVTPAGD
jgi:cell wall-associated NlpC family hydrolase